MDKRIILILAIIVLVFIAIGFIFGNHKWVGSVIAAFGDENDSYSYTTAMCNVSKQCQDYEVSCEGGEVVEMVPVTGAVVQHAHDWTDPREGHELCE